MYVLLNQAQKHSEQKYEHTWLGFSEPPGSKSHAFVISTFNGFPYMYIYCAPTRDSLVRGHSGWSQMQGEDQKDQDQGKTMVDPPGKLRNYQVGGQQVLWGDIWYDGVQEHL